MDTPKPIYYALHEKPHAVYFLYDAADRVIYIGMTSRPAMLMQLNLRKPWFGEVVRGEYEMVSDGVAAEARMKQSILEIRPRYNRKPHLTRKQLRGADRFE